MKKVYCIYCKHLTMGDDCAYPENTIRELDKTKLWYTQKFDITYIKHPKNINNKNNCSWFEKEDE